MGLSLTALAGCGGGGLAPITISLVGSVNDFDNSGTVAASVNISGTGRVAGDIAIAFSVMDGSGDPGAGTGYPSGFTAIIQAAASAGRSALSYKVLTGSETTITTPGYSDGTNVLMVVIIRPSRTATATVNDAYGEVTNANPASNTVNMSSASVGPVAGFGFLGASVGVGTPTASGWDTYIDETVLSAIRCYYKLSDSVPSNGVTDMADRGWSNATFGFYFTFA